MQRGHLQKVQGFHSTSERVDAGKGAVICGMT
jgi:hypothetical protein